MIAKGIEKRRIEDCGIPLEGQLVRLVFQLGCFHDYQSKKE
jgi:hypothetical protein